MQSALLHGWGLSVYSLTVNYNLESFSPREIVVYRVYTFRFRESLKNTFILALLFSIFKRFHNGKVSYHTCEANRVVTSQYAMQLQGCLTLTRIWIVDCGAIQSEKFHLCGWPQVSYFMSTP